MADVRTLIFLTIAMASTTAFTQTVSAPPAPYGVVLSAEAPTSGHSRLQEISPLVEDVEIIPGNPYIEVFVKGEGHLDCYDVREYLVEKLNTETRIVPRLRRSKPKEICLNRLSSFRDKAADLDPNQASSKKISVLGFRGWHYRTLP